MKISLWVLFIAAIIQGSSLEKSLEFFNNGDILAAKPILDSLSNAEGQSHQDSLLIWQYLGMCNSLIGLDKPALSAFSQLLKMDSTWRLPSNEDRRILRLFEKALKDLHTEKAETIKPALNLPRDTVSQRSSARDSLAQALQIELPVSSLTEAKKPLKKMDLSHGLIPLGIGWVIQSHPKTGLAYGMLQLGGLAVSIYASSRQSTIKNDGNGIEYEEQNDVRRWQLVQQISLSTSVITYLSSVLLSLEGK